MKLLLTSGGITNPLIHARLEALLGTPVSHARALYVPTAQWGHPACGPASVARSLTEPQGPDARFCGLGWASLGLLELAALPTIREDRWREWLAETDVLLVDGGDAAYLCAHMRRAGLAALLPALDDLVWVGMSAGSMVLTPRIGQQFLEGDPDASDETLGIVDFSIFPHLDYPGWSENTAEAARGWAAELGGSAYAIDDDSAISVVDGVVEVVSAGHWEQFAAGHSVAIVDKR